jgi:hypothetical protein
MSFTDSFIEWFYWLNDGGLIKVFDQVNNVMPNGIGRFIAWSLFCATILIIALIFLLFVFTIYLANKWLWQKYLNTYCDTKK